jgi:hypothetical protein
MNVLYAVTPELKPRLVAFQPASGMPSEAVAVDAWEGVARFSPGVRIIYWPEGRVWQCKVSVLDPETIDVLTIYSIPEHLNGDIASPRWAVGVVWDLLAELAAEILQRFAATESEELPPPYGHIYDTLVAKGQRMEAIFTAP